MDVTTRIRNLSVALEAVSKTPECGRLAASLWILLTQEVDKLEKEQFQGQIAARPADLTSHDTDPF